MDDSYPALLVLAAGLGTRYGGMKQLEPFGPNGEALMEYSIYDAIRAGFKKIVFVVNQAHISTFEKHILPKYQGRIEIEFVIQRIDDLPNKISASTVRKKPWGTGHAILCAKDTLTGPFAVINADDFYGASAFCKMLTVLNSLDPKSTNFCLIGYKLSNTLSENGSVSRGLCTVDNGYLVGIRELTNIRLSKGDILGESEGKKELISKDSVVSMNFWGFSPDIFTILGDRFSVFLNKYINDDNVEFYIAEPLDYAIKRQISKVKVYPTKEKWFGVTHPADKQIVRSSIQMHVNQGRYPEKL